MAYSMAASMVESDSMAAWTVASRVESWAECSAVSKADYLAAQMNASMAVLTVDYLAA